MISIDGEFTGLDPINHSLVSLGAVDFYNPSNQFYGECQMWEGALYDEEALKINGFTIEQLTDKSKMTLVEMIRKFDDWLKTCTNPQILIGQNPKSDIDFLVQSYKKAGIAYPLGHRSLDTHTIVFMRHLQLGKDILLERGRYKINLDESLKFVGIPGGEPRPHIALMGAKCAAEVVSRTVFGKKLLEDFNSFEIPDYLKIN
ncbi:MAG: exonuclease domain-containing protein [Candidatus Gracilibacteria bacterium]|nr:exonuclease domain-containing protein [Candidatus Gracilibacteria bacterium]